MSERAGEPVPDKWVQRRERFAAARAFRRLLDRSSLSEKNLWVECPEHGRSARDPFTDRCVNCG